VGRGLGGGTPVEQQKTLSGNRVSGEFDNTWIEALIAHMTWHLLKKSGGFQAFR
jgi:hypothetical protein